ncbi:MAG: SLBB domain-containing protein, partial [Candidatus Firestonebacteria bacterium]|nr:SLBB domain-containing protein [Candidatus Firestonebacteria bacterium]
MKKLIPFKLHLFLMLFLFFIGIKNIYADQIDELIETNKETVYDSSKNKFQDKEIIKSKKREISDEKEEAIRNKIKIKKGKKVDIKYKNEGKTKDKSKNKTEDNIEEKEIKQEEDSTIIRKTEKEIEKNIYSNIPSLADIYAGQVTQVLDQEVKPFGYDVFNIEPLSFTPLSDIPVNPDYILGPGDTIIVDVWGSITNQITLKVDRDGKIVLPSVGSIFVSGVEFGKLKDIIKEKLKKEYQNIDIEVTMGRLKTIRVYLVGELRYPGSYDISSLATVYNAIISAGGPSEQGSLRNIEVIRNKQVIAKIDFYDFLLTGKRTEDIRLQDGDTVFVNLISNTAKIIGMVKRPAIYEFLYPVKLSSFIELAGGTLPTGYLKNIQIERSVDNEKKIILNLNISDEQKSDLDK